ncbi:MAG: ABC transporter ATP-binding protein [Cyclobacteriaceae bacterium]|nr:ABC transporter ATP-binding protein [Cyclobacteriaceae bacterium]MCH8514818.1 ABC transporter ATP-binding protein [Cyclobacteriaceae bacterium]
MDVLQINDLEKRFSSKESFALKGIKLSVKEGELLALIGESGSGKTTLLRLIAGLDQPDKGDIFINGRQVVGKGIFFAPEKRKVGMVFQDYALFPHLTVYDNVKYGLDSGLANKNERVMEVLQLVGLRGMSKRYPHQLSGGQQQRAALARALAPEPKIILLDEPFSNLDGVLKEQVREELKKILKATHTTAVFVTHDTKDALSTADRVAILKEGSIQQLGSPRELYDKPANIYTANFFGKVNVVNAVAENGHFNSQIGVIPNQQGQDLSGKVMLAIRPEDLTASIQPTELYGQVQLIAYHGDSLSITLYIDHHVTPIKIILKAPTDIDIRVGERLYFKVLPEKVKVLDTCWYPAAAKLTQTSDNC